VIVGTPGCSCQVHVCAEGAIFIQSKSLIRDAIIDLFAAYFVFNICYPKYLDAILLFFQHYIFNLTFAKLNSETLGKLAENRIVNIV